MFHKANFGRFGESLPADLNGHVPEPGDKPSQFKFEDDEFTRDFDRNGDGYPGAAAEAWEDFVSRAVEATERAERAIVKWRTS